MTQRGAYQSQTDDEILAEGPARPSRRASAGATLLLIANAHHYHVVVFNLPEVTGGARLAASPRTCPTDEDSERPSISLAGRLCGDSADPNFWLHGSGGASQPSDGHQDLLRTSDATWRLGHFRLRRLSGWVGTGIPGRGASVRPAAAGTKRQVSACSAIKGFRIGRR